MTKVSGAGKNREARPSSRRAKCRCCCNLSPCPRGKKFTEQGNRKAFVSRVRREKSIEGIVKVAGTMVSWNRAARETFDRFPGGTLMKRSSSAASDDRRRSID